MEDNLLKKFEGIWSARILCPKCMEVELQCNAFLGFFWIFSKNIGGFGRGKLLLEDSKEMFLLLKLKIGVRNFFMKVSERKVGNSEKVCRIQYGTKRKILVACDVM